MYNSVVALATKTPIRITTSRIVTWEIQMARGTVKWFNPTKGYGFIQPQAGGKTSTNVRCSGRLGVKPNIRQ